MSVLAIEWNPPLGIELGFFTLRFYSLMFVMAFGLGYIFMKKMFVHEKLNIDILDKMLMYIVFATILGARLGHVIFYQSELFQQDFFSVFLPFRFKPHFQFTGFQGLASHGAAISLIISMYLFNRKYLKKSLLFLLDRFAILVALGGVFIRTGNLLNSEIIGYPTGTNYGFIFVELGENFARHPTQIYEAFGYLLVFILLWTLYWKTNSKDKQGFIFGLFFALLWTVRFVVEFFKEAQVDERSEWLLNTGQWLSIPLIFTGLYFVYRAQNKTISSKS